MPEESGTPGPRSRPHPGFFLVLDGPDGGGKTTQIARLSEWLRGRGFDVVTCRDPGGTELGNRLRAILTDRHAVPISTRAEMLLFLASRAQMIEEVIRPALEAGRVVLCDRYLLSTIVYQGYAGGLDPEEVAALALSAAGGLLPDLTLILDLPLEAARDRVGAARDRIEDRPPEYHARVRTGYNEIAMGRFAAFRNGRRRAKRSPIYEAPIGWVDASADPDTVFALIRREVMHVLAPDPRA